MIVADGSKSWVGLPRGYVYGWLGDVIMTHFGGEGMRAVSMIGDKFY